jgi:hypothetical protein
MNSVFNALQKTMPFGYATFGVRQINPPFSGGPFIVNQKSEETPLTL